MTVTPLKAGALIDATTLRSPEELDLDTIRDAYDTYGAVLIKGAGFGRREFVDLTERFPIAFMEYLGGANNDRGSAFGQSKTVLTVTGGAVEKQAIPLHGEMFYTRPYPRTLFFCCIRPADAAGQTTICDGVSIWNALPEDIRAVLVENKLRYRRIYADDAWKKVYQSDDLAYVRALCEEAGVTFIEHPDGSIETIHVTNAWHDHKAGRAFVNSALVWAAREYLAHIDDSQVRFEDGSEIPKEMLYRIHELAERLTLDIDWEPGMVAIVDNTRVMHGRRAYEDTERDIIMRLSLDSLSGQSAIAAE